MIFEHMDVNIIHYPAKWSVLYHNTKIDLIKITQAVAQFFDINQHVLLSKNLNKSLLIPRDIALYLSAQCTNLTLSQIGVYFGGRRAQSVRRACLHVQNLILKNSVISATLDDILRFILRFI